MGLTWLLATLFCFAVSIADLMDSSIYITTPAIVTAGTSFNASINVQWHGLADSSHAYAFRIYLGTSHKTQRFYRYDPECFLINEQSLCDATVQIFSDYIGFYDTPFTVTVPHTVGPSGKHYTLIGRIINTDGSYYGSTWKSDVFQLDGANGTWANYQERGRTLWGDDGIACNGFACVKKCADVGGGSSGNATYEDCANGCPDVHIDVSSSYGGQPTAALTLPSSCPAVSQSKPSGATTTSGIRSVPSTSSPLRAIVSAAATKNVGLCPEYVQLACLLWLIVVVAAS